MKNRLFLLLLAFLLSAPLAFSAVSLGAGWGPSNPTVVYIQAEYENRLKPFNTQVSLGVGKSSLSISSSFLYRFADNFTKDRGERVRGYIGGESGYIIGKEGYGTLIFRVRPQVRYSNNFFGCKNLLISLAISPYIGSKIYVGKWSGVRLDWGYTFSVLFEF